MHRITLALGAMSQRGSTVMKTSFQMTFAVAIAAALTMFSSPVVHAVGGSCRPRALTAEEQRAGERVLARLRPLLPPAPPGWKQDGADTIDIASGSCLEDGKSVPQPVSVQVHRKFVREGPPPAAPVAAAPAPKPSAPDPQLQARAKALEQQIADLKREEAATTAAYQAARRVGDSAAQRAASARSREIRLAMNAPLKELMEIEKAERLQREADNAAATDAAFAQNKATLANRRIAHVVITTNSGRALARASKVISISSVPFAITQPGFGTNLLFGNGWTHVLHEAYRPWEKGVPLSRVQDVNVRVEGNEEVMQALIGELDPQAVNAVIER